MTDIQPTTGVYSGGDLPWEWIDGEFIDLAYEAAVAELKASGMSDEDIDAELEYFDSGDEQLYGDWIKVNAADEPDDNGKYAPDPDGEFAAIHNTNECTLQVVFSRHIRYGKPAFLCYPGQVDAEQDDPAEPEGEPGYVMPWDQLKSTERRYVPYYALPVTGDSDD